MKEGIKYTLNDEKYYTRANSKKGRYLLRMPKTIQKLKLEEKMLCKK
tara:strand:- start:17377 stop:17517 length:141 start_codon:yes stop_codon:yes gene_type:complete